MRNKFFQLGNLIIDTDNIKAVVISPEFKVPVPKGYEGDAQEVFRVKVILHQPVRPWHGHDFNLYGQQARDFLTNLDSSPVAEVYEELPLSDEIYGRSIYRKTETEDIQPADASYETENKTETKVLVVAAIGRIGGAPADDVIHVPEENDQ